MICFVKEKKKMKMRTHLQKKKKENSEMVEFGLFKALGMFNQTLPQREQGRVNKPREKNKMGVTGNTTECTQTEGKKEIEGSEISDSLETES